MYYCIMSIDDFIQIQDKRVPFVLELKNLGVKEDEIRLVGTTKKIVNATVTTTAGQIVDKWKPSQNTSLMEHIIRRCIDVNDTIVYMRLSDVAESYVTAFSYAAICRDKDVNIIYIEQPYLSSETFDVLYELMAKPKADTFVKKMYQKVSEADEIMDYSGLSQYLGDITQDPSRTKKEERLLIESVIKEQHKDFKHGILTTGQCAKLLENMGIYRSTRWIYQIKKEMLEEGL